MFKIYVLLAVVMGCVIFAPQEASAVILIHEILADPPAGLAGDANRDGVGSSSDDEFVELFNSSANAVDLSGWSIRDAVRKRHVFPVGSWIQPNDLFIVFGGGVPNLPGVNWQLASTGTLSLNNSNETVTLLGLNDEQVDQVFFGAEGGRDQSLVRSPEAGANPFIEHTLLVNAQGRRYSPGEFINPPVAAQAPVPSAAVPEPATMGCFAAGFASYCAMRRRKKSLS